MATWVDKANNGMIETTWQWQGDRMMGTIRNGGNNDGIIGMVITNDDRTTKMMTMQLEQQWGILRMVMKQWERWHKDEQDSKKQGKWHYGQWKPMRDGEEW